MADRGYRGRPQRGERADRQINAGHSRGLDAALSDTEAKIRKLKTEHLSCGLGHIHYRQCLF